MLYLNSEHIDANPIDWQRIVSTIMSTVWVMNSGDYAQPQKPYLRFGNPNNRIIAMPAYVGGDVSLAGMKWIASFPANLDKGLARAHSVTVLNDASNGRPLALINATRVSEIRTAGVSAAVATQYFKSARADTSVVAGIVGFGPIGQTHLDMLASILDERLEEVRIYDAREVKLDKVPAKLADRIRVCSSWDEVYAVSDLFITATVSPERYIDRKPKPGSLHLNVSLRDYQAKVARTFELIAVDSWSEVCREDTDIEVLHKEMGLQEHETHSIFDILYGNAFMALDAQSAALFNPMGMAAFDVAVGGQFYRQALADGAGVLLAD